MMPRYFQVETDSSYLSIRVFQVRDRTGDSMVIFENPDPFEPFFRRMSRAFNEVMEIREPSSIERDAAIQRFEFTFEAVWKAVKSVLFEREGIDVGSPKAVIRAKSYLHPFVRGTEYERMFQWMYHE